MSLKKTACLAALLTSLPIVAPAASVSWDDNESHDRVERDGVWVVVSSGTSESELREQVFPVEDAASAVYDKVYIGHAKYLDGTDPVSLVESSYNKGTLKNGFHLKGQTTADNVNYLYGGVAEGNAQCQGAVAKGNQLYLKEGSHIGNAEITGANPSATFVYGGQAKVSATETGTAEASDNFVEFEKNSVIEGAHAHIYGGHASLSSAKKASALALNNTLSIDDGVQFKYYTTDNSMTVNFIGGVATASNATGPAESGDEQKYEAVEASDNKLNITYNPHLFPTFRQRGRPS